MHLIYIDESRDEKLYVFSALAFAVNQWHEAFQEVRRFRAELKQHDGIAVYTEFHAWKFVSGRGDIAEGRIVTKGRRCQVFGETLAMTAALPGVFLVNAVFPARDEEVAFDGLLTGIDRALQTRDSYGLLICDSGKETAYTRLARRRQPFNPLETRHLMEPQTFHEASLTRIIEDPFFKASDQSYFVQLADFCAYALLRRERPLASKTKYGLDQAFALLSPILAGDANFEDHEGIVRP